MAMSNATAGWTSAPSPLFLVITTGTMMLPLETLIWPGCASERLSTNDLRKPCDCPKIHWPPVDRGNRLDHLIHYPLRPSINFVPRGDASRKQQTTSTERKEPLWQN